MELFAERELHLISTKENLIITVDGHLPGGVIWALFWSLTWNKPRIVYILPQPQVQNIVSSLLAVDL